MSVNLTSQRVTSERRTIGSGFSFWPTARVSRGAYQRDHGLKGTERLTLEGRAVLWGTPCAHERASRFRKVHHGIQLANQAEKWPTPNPPSGGRTLSEEEVKAKGSTDRGKRQVDLANVVKFWPTPNAKVSNDGEDPASWLARRETLVEKGYNGNGAGTPLSIAAALWPTPAARDYKGANGAEHLEAGTGRKHMDQLPNFVAHSPQVQAISTDGETGSQRAVLNPRFVGSAARLPDRLDRLRCLGNSVVPIQAAVAFTILWKRIAGRLFMEEA